jgi:uncharacterized protein YpbB
MEASVSKNTDYGIYLEITERFQGLSNLEDHELELVASELNWQMRHLDLGSRKKLMDRIKDSVNPRSYWQIEVALTSFKDGVERFIKL